MNSYDIGGLSSAILRCVPSDSIRYIFGARGEGRRELHDDTTYPLHYSNYIYIQSDEDVRTCNNPTIGSYNHYHLSPNGIPRGNQRWYGLVYFIQIAGKPRIRPRELLSNLEVLY